jgi:small conductance mechanosensitive channel
MLPFETTPPPTETDLPTLWTDVLSVLAAIGGKALAVAIIVASCFLIGLVLRVVIRRVVHRIVDTAKSKAAVDDTQAIERSPLADMRLIDNALLGSLTLLTAAVGAGLGFGAQNIVKDVLNGIFLVAEDQIGIGDVVDLGLASGVVEYVSVRITQVRDVNGTLWYVRNGEVTRIGNMSQGWARAIIDLGVPPDADLDQVEHTMLETAVALAKDPKWRTRIIEKPELWGLESIDGDALVVRVVIKTRANAKDDVAQELRKRLRAALAEKEIAIPRMQTISPTGLDGARRVRGANPPRTRPNAVTGVPAPDRGFWRRKKTTEDGSPQT